MNGQLRVGRIAALNMYPLYHHLENEASDQFVFTDGVPTTLNRALVAGNIDVSAMSSIEFARHRDELRLLPVASITAGGAVDSIQVFSKVPFRELTQVAVTPHSATSVALLRILVGPSVTFVPLDGTPEEALERFGAVLLIGDQALVTRNAGISPHTTDLGEVWSRETGLPMVFAVWAVRRDLPEAREPDLARLATLLSDAQDAYRRQPERVIAAAAHRFPFSEPFIRTYLARLSYGFNDAERAALQHFYHRAVAAGELDRTPALAA